MWTTLGLIPEAFSTTTTGGNQKQTMETAKTENWQKSDAFLKSVASKKNKKLPSETLIEAKHPSWEVIRQPLVVLLGENDNVKTTT